MVKVSRVAGGQKNITLHVTGVLESDLPTGQMTEIEVGDSQAKLASLVWLIQEKLGLRLWWDTKTPLLPMESRNSVRFDTPIYPPKGWDGKLFLTSFNFAVEPKAKEKWFFLVIDFDR